MRIGLLSVGLIASCLAVVPEAPASRGIVAVGINLGGPVYPRPWYGPCYYPYYRPYPVYVGPPPVIYAPAPVYFQPAPVYATPVPVIRPVLSNTQSLDQPPAYDAKA